MSEELAISDIGPGESGSERDDVFRLRYRIQVEGQGLSGPLVDHDRKMLEEPDDGDGHLIQARSGDALVGALRLNRAGDGGFTERQSDDFVLPAFLEIVAPAQILLVERLVIEPALSDGDLLLRMLAACLDFAKQRQVQLVFAACEPPQVRRYLDVGFRTYTRRTINSPDTGYLVPLVLVVADIDYLRAVGSPLADASTDFAEGAPVSPDLARLLGGSEAILSRKLFLKEEFWDRLKRSAVPANVQEIGLFDGLTEDQVRACLQNSTSFECEAGYRVIEKGDSATNMYMVLSGTLEVRDEGEVVAIISAGEVFGEIAFFLSLPRTMDVVAATNGVKVVSFSESTIRKLIHHESEIATKLLINISKMLCTRVVKQA